MSTKLHWGRIFAGAFLVELALVIMFVPLLSSFDISTLTPFVFAAVFAFGFVISRWLLKNVRGRHVLHGILIGVIATGIYIVLCAVSPGGIASVIEMYGPAQFFVGNVLRILACAMGGIAARPRTP